MICKLLGITLLSDEEKILKGVLKELNTIRDLNRGGCGIAAYGIMEFIIKNLHSIEPKVIYLCDDKEWVTQERFTCAHAVVQIGEDRYVDSKGFHTLNQLRERWSYLEEVQLQPNEALKNIEVTRGWNSCYKRYSNHDLLCSILCISRSSPLRTIVST